MNQLEKNENYHNTLMGVKEASRVCKYRVKWRPIFSGEE
jgi:hypothetical protein